MSYDNQYSTLTRLSSLWSHVKENKVQSVTLAFSFATLCFSGAVLLSVRNNGAVPGVSGNSALTSNSSNVQNQEASYSALEQACLDSTIPLYGRNEPDQATSRKGQGTVIDVNDEHILAFTSKHVLESDLFDLTINDNTSTPRTIEGALSSDSDQLDFAAILIPREHAPDFNVIPRLPKNIKIKPGDLIYQCSTNNGVLTVIPQRVISQNSNLNNHYDYVATRRNPDAGYFSIATQLGVDNVPLKSAQGDSGGTVLFVHENKIYVAGLITSGRLAWLNSDLIDSNTESNVSPTEDEDRLRNSFTTDINAAYESYLQLVEEFRAFSQDRS